MGKANLTVNLALIPLDEDQGVNTRGFPIFRQVGVTIDLDGDETHNRSGFRSTRSEPCNRSTTSPLVINRAHTIDLATKAYPCMRIEEHKQEHGRCKHKLQIERI